MIRKYVIKDIVKEYRDHYKNYGWEIGYENFLNDIIDTLLGQGWEAELLVALREKYGVKMLFDDMRGVSSRRKRQWMTNPTIGYSDPIYFELDTGKIKIGAANIDHDTDVFIGGL